jgi:regulatory protein YycI of two-component signal transduction system YycFG
VGDTMKTLIIILIIIAVLFLYCLLFACFKVAGDADKRAEEQFKQYIKSQNINNKENDNG